jgi:hypothetical protein
MAHFARLDENNIVIDVLVVRNEDILDNDGNESEEKGITFLKTIFGQDTIWKQTSYNNSFRVRYAGIGSTYNADYDAFIPPRMDETWEFNYETLDWIIPEDPPGF